MGAYRLLVFDESAAREISFEFEAQSDRDAVEVGAAAAGGERSALWRDGRLLLRLDKFAVDQPTWAYAGAD